MLIYKILQSFVEPSVFIGTIFIIGLFYFFNNKKEGKYLIGLGIILYFLFSYGPFTNFLLNGLEGQYDKLLSERVDEADIIVIFSGGGISSQLRVDEAIRLYHLKNKESRIIFSGASPLSDYSEGQLFKNYLIERGVDGEDIEIEDQSRNTYENALNVKEIIGEKSFFLVTADSHMPRSIEACKELGLNPIPAVADSRTVILDDLTDHFPSGYNLYNADLAIHEYLGLWFYRFYY
jgi:uncharacterized SAM-binding protein YcdF (DUF218 family)